MFDMNKREIVQRVFGILARPPHITFHNDERGVNIADTFFVSPTPFEAKTIRGSTFIEGWALQDGEGEPVGEVSPNFADVVVKAMQEWAALSIKHLI